MQESIGLRLHVKAVNHVSVTHGLFFLAAEALYCMLIVLPCSTKAESSLIIYANTRVYSAAALAVHTHAASLYSSWQTSWKEGVRHCCETLEHFA